MLFRSEAAGSSSRLAAAHTRYRLMLLGSPPDMVHGLTLRGTGCQHHMPLQTTAQRPESAAPRTGAAFHEPFDLSLQGLFILLHFPQMFKHNFSLFHGVPVSGFLLAFAGGFLYTKCKISCKSRFNTCRGGL